MRGSRFAPNRPSNRCAPRHLTSLILALKASSCSGVMAAGRAKTARYKPSSQSRRVSVSRG